MKSETRKTPLDAWIGRKIASNDRGTGPTLEAIRTYQLNRLKETIDYARMKSPFYGMHLAHFSSDAISDLRDVESLPFTTADDIRINPWPFLAISQDEIARIVTLHTSGTTGDSKRLFFTTEDLELTIDFFCHGMSTLVRPGQRVLILLPGDKPDSVGDLLTRGLGRMNVEGIIHGPVRDVRAAVDEIVQRNIDCLVGIPTQVLALARSKAGCTIGKDMIKSVLLSTDYVSGAIVNELNRVWGCPVYNHYGMTEMGLGGGVECEAREGYHLREADLYFEVVDHCTGKPLADGETGEVVFTTLTRKGMPLIRYRTGDIARFIPEPCPCGSVLRRLDNVKGRWHDRVTITGTPARPSAGHPSSTDGSLPTTPSCSPSSLDNSLTPETVLTLPDMDEALFPLPGLLNYQVTLAKRGARACLEIAIFGEWSERGNNRGSRRPLRQPSPTRTPQCGAPSVNRWVAPDHPLSRQESLVSEVILKTLEKVPAIRDAIAGGCLELLPVRFVEENWFTTGTAKRRIIDQRYLRE